MTKKLSVQFAMAAILMTVWLPRANAQTVWVKHPGNPVMDVGAAGEWDDSWVNPGNVLFLDDTYHSWYQGGQETAGGESGYATSTDGVTWIKYDDAATTAAPYAESDPIFRLGPAGDWDDERSLIADVIFDGTTYHAWYGGQAVFDESWGNWLTGYATSTDGITWTKYDDPATTAAPYSASDPVLNVGPAGDWDDVSVAGTEVIFDGTAYHMWYEGGNSSTQQIGYATSTDGITWTKYDDPTTTAAPYAASDPVLTPGSGDSWDNKGLYTPTVYIDSSGCHMLYTGSKLGGGVNIGYATSTDTLTWEKHALNPVLTGGPTGTWDEGNIWGGQVLYDAPLFQMWYSGYGLDHTRIGYATSLSGFEGLSVTPVFAGGSETVSVTAQYTGDTTGLQLFAELEASDGSTLDSVLLYDDGAHGDGAADDDTFGNDLAVPAGEAFYAVGLQARSGESELINYDGLDWFTTVGPVTCTGDSTALRSRPEDPYYPELYLTLTNEGATATAEAASAVLEALDTCVTSISLSSADFGDIPAGSAVTGTYQVEFNTNCGFGTQVQFLLAISSDGQVYWQDTLTIPIRPLGYGPSVWYKCNKNPVVEAGPIGAWDSYFLLEPCVIRVGDTYKMWYDGTDGSKEHTGYAEASVETPWLWTKYNDPATTAAPYAASDPVLVTGPTGTWDDVIAGNPSVVFDGTTYHMWYWGWDLVFDAIGYATSADGISWTKYDDPATTTARYAYSDPVLEPGPPGSWDDAVFGPQAVILVDTTYMLWYRGRQVTTRSSIGLATSSDGINWTKYAQNPVMTPDAAGWEEVGIIPEAVIYDGGAYHLWYVAFDAADNLQTGHATSIDGIDWTKNPKNPVLGVGGGDNVTAAAGAVLFDGTDYHLWYDNYDGVLGPNGAGSIGYASTNESVTTINRIDEKSSTLPVAFVLHQNYPNPFNPVSMIRYELPQASDVSLIVYDILGREVARLVNGTIEPGYHSVQWEARDMKGRIVPSGIYIAKLETPEYSESIKMVLLR